MAGAPLARIVLLVDPAAVPIVGELHREDSLPVAFSGWMGLFSLLDQELRALGDPGVADSTAAPGEPGTTERFGGTLCEAPDG